MASQAKIGTHKTTIKTVDKYMVVTYHSTDIVKFNDQEIILNSGGWLSATTKSRMNQTANQFDLGYRVIQKDYEWFINFNGRRIKFYDNITLKR